MKKLMIESLARLRLLASAIFVQPIAAIGQAVFWWVKRKVSPPLKISLTRQSLMIALPASQGGRLHILPRPGGASGLTRTFEVITVDDEKYVLNASPDNLALATYSNKSEAALALSTLNKALTGSLVWKWGFRIFLVWLAWLFITSYMEVRQQTAGSSKPYLIKGDPIVYGPAQDAPPNIPSEPAPFQSVPSPASGADLTNYIYQQAKLAQEKAQKDALPPKSGVDNAAGLAAFGLKGAESNGSGGGCDPKLAFKVPQK